MEWTGVEEYDDHHNRLGAGGLAWALRNPHGALRLTAVVRPSLAHAPMFPARARMVRNTLVQLGQTLCRDAEQFKAWSQNMGHDAVLTTFLSYGTVSPRRQGQIIQTLGLDNGQPAGQAEVVAQAVLQAMRGAGLLSQQS